MARTWTAETISELTRGYQPACVLAAAADLDLFNLIRDTPVTAAEAAQRLGADARGTAVLLDALTALSLLDKSNGRYTVPPSLVPLLTSAAPRNILAMTQHQANCLRSWAHLARAVKTGGPVDRQESIRGAEADHAAFIEAMDNVSGPVADDLIARLPLPPFQHLLDVGGASGTWTAAFLRAHPGAGAHPGARATLFDLPAVIPQAQRRLTAAGLIARVTLVPGDFYTDPLPSGGGREEPSPQPSPSEGRGGKSGGGGRSGGGGPDLAWVSAIVHQNSRQQNRALFAKVFAALAPGGHILIRDLIMDATRTRPVAGALFAVNMLVHTPAGGTFTFDELREDLESAGFAQAKVLHDDPGMNSVLAARRPDGKPRV